MNWPMRKHRGIRIIISWCIIPTAVDDRWYWLERLKIQQEFIYSMGVGSWHNKKVIKKP